MRIRWELIALILLCVKLCLWAMAGLARADVMIVHPVDGMLVGLF